APQGRGGPRHAGTAAGPAGSRRPGRLRPHGMGLACRVMAGSARLTDAALERRWYHALDRAGALCEPIGLRRRDRGELPVHTELLCSVHRPIWIVENLARDRDEVSLALR